MSSKQTTKITRSLSIAGPINSVEPKTIAAVFLVVVMAGLWVRVLLRSGPASASAMNIAAGNEALVQQESNTSDVAIRVIPLATIAGRHDMIADDFFKADRCSVWNQQAAAAPVSQSVDEGASQRLFGEITRAISVEAIIKDAGGNAEKACVNGAIVSAGSQLQVAVKNKTYNVRIVSIETGQIQVHWQDHSIAIEMPDQKVN